MISYFLAVYQRDYVQEYKDKVARKREEKKNRMKQMFDSEYDAQGINDEGGNTYFQDLKDKMEAQTKVSLLTFIYSFKSMKCLPTIMYLMNQHNHAVQRKHFP